MIAEAASGADAERDLTCGEITSTSFRESPQMNRIVLAAAMIASLLALAKSERVLDRTGLVGSCAAIEAPAPPDGQWTACRPGKLTGYPDLSQNSCTRRGMRGEVRYWICPSALVAARAPEAQPTR